MREPILSPREKQHLRRIAAGKTDQEIREKLGGTLEQIAEQRDRPLKNLRSVLGLKLTKQLSCLAHWKAYRGIT